MRKSLILKKKTFLFLFWILKNNLSNYVSFELIIKPLTLAIFRLALTNLTFIRTWLVTIVCVLLRYLYIIIFKKFNKLFLYEQHKIKKKKLLRCVFLTEIIEKIFRISFYFVQRFFFCFINFGYFFFVGS